MTDVQVYEKDDVRFEVEVSRTPKTFRWLKGSQELQSDEKYEVIQEGNLYVLVIRSAAYDDEAKYMFEAEDKRTTGKLVIQGNVVVVFIFFLNSFGTSETFRESGHIIIICSHLDQIIIVLNFPNKHFCPNLFDESSPDESSLADFYLCFVFWFSSL